MYIDRINTDIWEHKDFKAIKAIWGYKGIRDNVIVIIIFQMMKIKIHLTMIIIVCITRM